MNARDYLVDIVVPAYDEERTLGPNVELLLEYLRAALRTAWAQSDADAVSYMDVDLSTNLESFLPLVPAPV